MHSFIILEEVQKAKKAALSSVQNRCIRDLCQDFTHDSTALFFLAVYCWMVHLRALPAGTSEPSFPGALTSCVLIFLKKKKKVLLAIRKIPLPVSSWETCCLVGRKYFFTLVCWQNPTWLSLFAVLGALCGMWSALWAVLDPWTTLGLSKEAASGLMCSLHGEHRAEQISCPRNTPKSLSDLHGGAQKAWQPLSFQTSLHLRIHWLC